MASKDKASKWRFGRPSGTGYMRVIHREARLDPDRNLGASVSFHMWWPAAGRMFPPAAGLSRNGSTAGMDRRTLHRIDNLLKSCNLY